MCINFACTFAMSISRIGHHSSGIRVEEAMATDSKAFMELDENGLSVINSIISLLKGDQQTAFFQLSVSAISIAKTSVSLSSEFGSHFLDSLGHIPVIGMVGLAISFASAAYFEYKAKLLDRRLHKLEDDILHLDNLEKMTGFFNNIPDPAHQDWSEAQKNSRINELNNIQEQHNRVYKQIITPYESRISRLEQQIKELTEDIQKLSTQSITNNKKIDKLSQKKSYYEDVLANIEDTVSQYKARASAERTCFNNYQSLLSTPAHYQENLENLKNAKIELQKIDSKLLPMAKEERKLLKNIAHEEQKLVIVARQARKKP